MVERPDAYKNSSRNARNINYNKNIEMNCNSITRAVKQQFLKWSEHEFAIYIQKNNNKKKNS